MICRDIYKLSLNLLAQDADNSANLDFENRAPYLLALFCMETQELDRHLREQMGVEEGEELSRLYLNLSDTFPLLDSLLPAAALYLAAMLVIDEDEELYEKIYEQYCDVISKLQSGFSFELESIEDLYSLF